MTQYKYDVSIVIVCMNNLKMLYPCLESIKKYTTCSYEVLVTAYLFTPENLKKVREDFPWVTFIESNEIRGFSENNNLALRQAQGKYCFVFNDDTEIKTDAITRLISTFESLPADTAIVSPKILLGKNEVVLSGKPEYTFATFLKDCSGFGKNRYQNSPYTFKDGVFLTYNISGAAFLIRTDIFEDLGWFDEKYFFCPEDIALSTEANKKGYKVYVDSDAIIYHYSGGTWSTTIAATKPASVKGEYYFYCGNSIFKKIFFISFVSVLHFARMCYWFTIGKKKGEAKAKTMAKANWNAVKALCSNKTPKELFTQYYKEIKARQQVSVK